jgi:ATP-dependent helicase/nuclease subunit A
MTFEHNAEQQSAIDAEGRVFVSAGAGTGKTRVLVERFARAVLDRGLAPDSVLAITYTERAAAELSARIRERLVNAGEPARARELDNAWISTIHGFCARLLRRYALPAGLDPGFVVLDAAGAEILRMDAYQQAVEAACDRSPAMLDLVVAYGETALRNLIDATHERLRSAGHPLQFAAVPGPTPDIDNARQVAVDAAMTLISAAGDGVYLRESRARAAAFCEFAASQPDATRLVDIETYRPIGKLAAAAVYDAALDTLTRAARDAAYEMLRPLLDDLLGSFAAAYAERKHHGSLLDFDDLQLEARRVLETRADVREDVRSRFADVLIDEFQDTNELQCALIDAVTGPQTSLFFVGDEFQSIYRFRHADVAVFRRRHAAARSGDGSSIAMRTNYRSRPEVLAAVNHLFAQTFDGYQPLVAGGSFPELATDEPAVEFLVTDADTARAAPLVPRDAEARALARRLADLIGSGACTAADIVVLFAASTDADRYERALRDASIATVAATGRRYFEAQAVRDVLAYLRLIRTRYDDAALLCVLASPLVGVSNDTLALLRDAAPKRPLFTAIEHGIPASIETGDAQLLAAFRQRFDRLVDAAAHTGLPRLVERIVEEHDYDLALLRHPAGGSWFANLRKLARLAREYEALRGPDLEGFVTALEVRRLAADREPDALITEESADAVRLMTVHAAKGLEFPVVVVADAGRGAGPRSEEVIALPDGRVGIKVPDATGRLHETSVYRDAQAAHAQADEAERRRVTYVALTRAAQRLIVSGCVNTRQLRTETTPIAWMLNALGADLTAGDSIIDVGGARVSIRISAVTDEPADRQPGSADDDTANDATQLVLFADVADVGPLPPPVASLIPPAVVDLAPPPPPQPGRLSFSALHLFERCPYRFYAERILQFREPQPPPHAAAEGLAATDIGNAVHDALEHASRPLADTLARYPAATDADRDRITSLVAAWYATPLAAQLAGRGGRAETGFLLAINEAVITGRFDLIATDGEEWLIVDYKTNRLDGREPEAVRDHDYAMQEAVYALAALEASAPRVTVHFAFLDAPRVVSHSFDRSTLDALRARVGSLVQAVTQGPYPPRPGEVCGDCPIRGMLCAGPDLDPFDAAPDA